MKTADFNRFSVHLPDEAVADCHHQGSCDDDLEYWAPKLNLNLDPADLRAELREYGAWSEWELRDHEQNIRRIIWLAAGNIQDNERETAKD